MESRDTGSRMRSRMCWPVGRPRGWEEVSREKVKMRVSDDTGVLDTSLVCDQVRGERKMGRGDEVEVSGGAPEVRVRREEGERVPMWWVGIISFAVSLSGLGIRG